MKIIGIILVILLLLLQYKMWIAGDGISQTIQLKKAIVAQARKNEPLNKQNDELVAQIQDLKSGKEVIEDLARENLGLIRNDETYYRILK